MREKVEVLVGKLHEMMSVAESCQNTCRDLSDKAENFEQTLIRLQLLRVEIEHMRQLTHGLEMDRLALSDVPKVSGSEVEAEIASATAEPDPPEDVDPDDLIGSTPFPNA